MLRFSETDGALTFSVRVVPRASKTAVAGEHDGALKVRIAAPPVEGAANEELTRFLAYALGVPTRAVEILGGHTSKLKRLRVRGAQSARLISLAGGTQE
jgi:uncharacterized protein (TIGR00251 family)